MPMPQVRDSIALILTLGTSLQPLAFTQTDPPVFEAASVKPGTPVQSSGATRGKSTGSRITEDRGRITYQNTTLMPILMRAYDVKRRQIAGPAWLESETYDIAATIPNGASKEQIPAMLQNLLAERFKMIVRVDNRRERIYALVGGKSPRLKQSKETESSLSFNPQGHVEFMGYTLAGFAEFLTTILDRSVIDSTGLQGRFDIAADLDLGRLKLKPPDTASQDAADPLPSVFTAVQDLGLKLEVREATVKHMIIDKAEKIPTPN